MSNMYDALAPFYDALNSEIDYEAWADAIVRGIRTLSDEDVHVIADIGCGTGSMTLPLAARGYQVLGIDLSLEMLNVAYQRALDAEASENIQYLLQDMTALELGNRVDAMVCALDGLNHLTDRKQLVKCFCSVSEWLRPGGLFFFDLNSLYKFEQIYGEEVYTMESDSAFCVWQNDYHPRGKFCDFWITLFEKRRDGSYIRSDAVQREHYFSQKTVKNALAEAGMELIFTSGTLDGSAITENDERWYFVAKKGI